MEKFRGVFVKFQGLGLFYEFNRIIFALEKGWKINNQKIRDLIVNE
jgi:hypothetical protein